MGISGSGILGGGGTLQLTSRLGGVGGGGRPSQVPRELVELLFRAGKGGGTDEDNCDDEAVDDSGLGGMAGAETADGGPELVCKREMCDHK